jgi:uncharacterized protein (TIGR02145 family)
MKKAIFTLLIILCGSFLVAQSKIALVIGNADYKDMPLKNPQNDAYDLTVTLRSLGFDVIQKTDLNRRGIEDAIREFKGKISPGDVALFYFSGHGTQVDGLNYLIPVNESISNAIDVKYNCVDAGFVLDHMEQARSGINIIILDACRNNPFKGHRSASRGFAFMSAPTGSIIAYSTSPGSVAQDGDGRNSPFTKNLIEKIKIPGLKIEEVFKEVRKDVASETGRQQIPWESSSLMGDFYFKGDASSAPSNNKIDNYNPPLEAYSPPHESFSGNSGTFTDTRDQQSYKWVRIGSQIWMAENLNYLTENSWCFDNDKAKCDKYGRLYNWNAAKKACPSGWHLPNDDEWNILIGKVGNDPGYKLKSKSGWGKNGNGNDVYGFVALPGGICQSYSIFYLFEEYAEFWSSSVSGSYKAYHWSFSNKSDGVYHYYINKKEFCISVRCTKD